MAKNTQSTIQVPAREIKRVTSWEEIQKLHHGDACQITEGGYIFSEIHYFYKRVNEREFTFPGALFFHRTENRGIIRYCIYEEYNGLSCGFSGGITSRDELLKKMMESEFWGKKVQAGEDNGFSEALERALYLQGALGRTPETSEMTGNWDVADEWLKKYEQGATR